jgi:hypothetical protein
MRIASWWEAETIEEKMKNWNEIMKKKKLKNKEI